MPEARTTAPTATPAPTTQQPRRRRIPLWQFAVPLALQVLLILAVPARDAYTFATGTTVVLQTAPVDPYDLLRGYYQTLGYEISQVETLRELSGGADLFAEERRNGSFDFYTILQAPAKTDAEPPLPWQPVRVSPEAPEDLTDEQVALRGQYRDGQITYDLEQYYMPEAQRDRLNDAIQTIQRSEPQAFRVTAKVDATGEAVPVSLWVGDRQYRF